MLTQDNIYLNWSIILSCLKMFFTSKAWCSLRLLQLKTEEQTIFINKLSSQNLNRALNNRKETNLGVAQAFIDPWEMPSILGHPKGSGKKGHIVAETLLLMIFPCARKLGNICRGHKMFLNKIRNIFVSRTQNLCLEQMLRTRANGETFVFATMCPQQIMCPRLPVP